MNQPTDYTSYLVRLWQEPLAAEPHASIWCVEVEHIQSGACRRFRTLDELQQYLQQHAFAGVDHAPGIYDE